MRIRIPYRLTYYWACLRDVSDLRAAAAFISNRRLPITFRARLAFVRAIYRISRFVDCPHTQAEILAVATALLSMPTSSPGCVVEAGCFKGGSTAKLSLAAKLANRELVAFDSFEGLPKNDERHGTSIHGETPNFSEGRYLGTLDEVKASVASHGDIARCQFIKGWFNETMPLFKQGVAVAFLDVDLASSTRTALANLYPLVVPGGCIFSQDGHLPLVIDVLKDDQFWRQEVQYPKPLMEGLGTQKLVRIRKDFSSSTSIFHSS